MAGTENSASDNGNWSAKHFKMNKNSFYINLFELDSFDSLCALGINEIVYSFGGPKKFSTLTGINYVACKDWRNDRNPIPLNKLKFIFSLLPEETVAKINQTLCKKIFIYALNSHTIK